jgi:hypothetical protein
VRSCVYLHALSKELKDLNMEQQMIKVASVFTNARNVSAQESSYRICQILKLNGYHPDSKKNE